jgi:uncharacterized tellurite resistance protein B-like protein
MLRAISQWLAAHERVQEEDREARLQLAGAILLFEVAKSDQQFEAIEFERIQQVLREQWQLDDVALHDLLEVAGRESDMTASLYEHVDTINAGYSNEQKYQLLLGLWQVAAVDGEIHHYEEHLVRRVADMLYLSHSDFIRAKHQVTGD